MSEFNLSTTLNLEHSGQRAEHLLELILEVPSPFQKSWFFTCVNSNFPTRFLTIGKVIHHFVANLKTFEAIFDDFAYARRYNCCR